MSKDGICRAEFGGADPLGAGAELDFEEAEGIEADPEVDKGLPDAEEPEPVPEIIQFK